MPYDLKLKHVTHVLVFAIQMQIQSMHSLHLKMEKVFINSGLLWHNVADSSCMAIQASCTNRLCNFWCEKLEKRLKRWGLPDDDQRQYIICTTPPAREFFKSVSRHKKGDIWVFEGNLLDMLNPEEHAKKTRCPGRRRAIGDADGPELITIGFRGCQLQFRLDFEITTGRQVQVQHIPEGRYLTSGKAFCGAGSMKLRTIQAEWRPMLSYSNLVKLEVEMQDWPTGFTVNGRCTNRSCNLNKAQEQFYDSVDGVVISCRSLGLGAFIIEHSHGGDLVVHDQSGGIVDLRCDACHSPLKNVESISLVCCACQIETPQKRHAKFLSCAGAEGGLNEVQLFVNTLALFMPDIFPLKVTCERIKPGARVRGPCSRGDDCPLQDKQLKEILDGNTEVNGTILVGYGKVIAPQRSDGRRSWQRVVDGRCKPCLEDSGYIKAQGLSVYQ